MKLIQILFVGALLVVAFSAVSAPVAFADTTDPILLTKGCGGAGQPACDFEVLGPGQTSLTVTESFACDPTTLVCTASDSVVNETGLPVGSFTLALSAMDSNGNTLIYSCDTEHIQFFACSPTGNPDVFTFSGNGNTLCSDSDDFVGGVFTPDGDECGVTISLSGTESEGLSNNDVVTGTFATAPEPSSALLLLFGLLTGMVGLKYFRAVAA